jgi:hypothetical protein
LSAIQIIKIKGGCLEDSFLDEGKTHFNWTLKKIHTLIN